MEKKRGKRAETPEQKKQKASMGFYFKSAKPAEKMAQLDAAIIRYETYLANCRIAKDNIAVTSVADQIKMLTKEQKEELKKFL